ncbi:MAG: hypothetical protein K2O16_03090 [Lachnospiraceae bacterium]|nr:hypothetical protein [Lachnospiraceae bacterium]
MRRALLENNRVIINPGIVDRHMFLSAIFAIKAAEETAEETAVGIKFEHCDTEDGEFEVVTDTELCLDARIDPKTGTLPDIAVKGGEDVNIDLDLIGCKRFIKITVSIDGTDSSSVQTAIVLGDSSEVPV